jgi:pilus assembly protein Flp/PilA
MKNFISLMQVLQEVWQKHTAVTSIEYALIGSLIAVVILGSVGSVGTNLSTYFTLTANCVVFAVTGSGSCS